jgi:hypothetical protein
MVRLYSRDIPICNGKQLEEHVIDDGQLTATIFNDEVKETMSVK